MGSSLTKGTVRVQVRKDTASNWTSANSVLAMGEFGLETDTGYIKIGESPDNHVIRQEFIDLFVSDFDSMFAELISKYPMKVNSSSRGVRVLHAKDPDAMANKKARMRYKKIVDNKVYKHKYIMKCLDKQLAIERNNLEYLQNLETWINNHTWEKYENLDENAIQKDPLKPRITRSL